MLLGLGLALPSKKHRQSPGRHPSQDLIFRAGRTNNNPMKQRGSLSGRSTVPETTPFGTSRATLLYQVIFSSPSLAEPC